MQTYKELLIWQQAKRLVLLTYQASAKFPRSESFNLISQINRCAISVPSNIAEGWSRQSTKEFINFLYIARGSLSELETQLEISHELHFVSDDDLVGLQNTITELSKMITTVIRKLKEKSLTANRLPLNA